MSTTNPNKLATPSAGPAYEPLSPSKFAQSMAYHPFGSNTDHGGNDEGAKNWGDVATHCLDGCVGCVDCSGIIGRCSKSVSQPSAKDTTKYRQLISTFPPSNVTLSTLAGSSCAHEAASHDASHVQSRADGQEAEIELMSFAEQTGTDNSQDNTVGGSSNGQGSLDTTRTTGTKGDNASDDDEFGPMQSPTEDPITMTFA